MLLIRRATPDDALAATDVLRASITQLCTADHQVDPAHLSAWLANKTPQTWITWSQRPDACLLVAERHGTLQGVGMIDSAGEVLLAYVAPTARFTGVSRALLTAMEDIARAQGLSHVTATSTQTALRFYLAQGYVATDAVNPRNLRKTVQPALTTG
jgi:GNAT superfamily N-acetyltransferase